MATASGAADAGVGSVQGPGTTSRKHMDPTNHMVCGCFWRLRRILLLLWSLRALQGWSSPRRSSELLRIWRVGGFGRRSPDTLAQPLDGR